MELRGEDWARDRSGSQQTIFEAIGVREPTQAPRNTHISRGGGNEPEKEVQKQLLQKREENQDNVVKLQPRDTTGWGQQCRVEVAHPAVGVGHLPHLVCKCVLCISRCWAPGLGRQAVNRTGGTVWKGEQTHLALCTSSSSLSSHLTSSSCCWRPRPPGLPEPS